jgi:hypothetical protein
LLTRRNADFSEASKDSLYSLRLPQTNPARSRTQPHFQGFPQSAYDLMTGGYSVEWLGDDDGSRELVQIRLADGRDAGDVLLGEGHAVRWPHAPGVWCK